MRVALCVLVAALTPACAVAAMSERDKAWDALIAAAKAHGGVVTKLDQSSNYVFQRPDGSFVTFTQMLNGGKRAACLVAKKQDATVCIDWDSGKTTYGDRKDAASPWVIHAARPADEDTETPGLLASLLSGFGNILVNGPNFYCCDRWGNLRFSAHK
jgi:hypothetical protein